MSNWSDIWPRQGGARSPLAVWLDRISRVLAALGGLVIFGVAITVAISVVMRNLGLGSIRGDFELVEMSCAFAAGLFLPLCQLNRGHVMVDLFTNWLPSRAQRGLDWLWLLFFAAGWACLAVLTFHGMLESREYGDRTMLLSLPLWWTFLPALLGSAISCVIALSQVAWPRAMAESGSGD